MAQEQKMVISLTLEEYKILQLITQYDGGTIHSALRWLVQEEGRRRGRLETSTSIVKTGGIYLTSDEVSQIVTDFTVEFVRNRLGQLRSIMPAIEDSTLQLIDKLCDHLAHFDAHREIGLGNTVYPQQWMTVALYGQYLIDNDAETIRALTKQMAETIFQVPGLEEYPIPESWADTPIGRLWWCAVVRMEGDELITLAEASQLSGISLPALSNRLTAGTLKAYINPMAPNPRKGRTLVKRADVLTSKR